MRFKVTDDYEWRSCFLFFPVRIDGYYYWLQKAKVRVDRVYYNNGNPVYEWEYAVEHKT